MALPVQVRLGAPPLRMIMSIDIHSEIQETRDTRIRLLAEIEVLEYILKQIDIKRSESMQLDKIEVMVERFDCFSELYSLTNEKLKDAEIFLESISND